ncbi:MAG: deoxyribodipyrimidine photo-lyase [Desulfatitalea sp.]|nr:deoxyribodipyrimidine photo-lyase [Desulfatitalea sp.]
MHKPPGFPTELPASLVVDPARVRQLNDRPLRSGDYVLYWMQQSQRAADNHALTYGIEAANLCRLPLLVVFGLTMHYPEANRRHFSFMLEGLRETSTRLAQQGIRLAMVHGHPPEVALKAGRKAALVICDRGYLRHQKQWRTAVAGEAQCPVVEIESDAVVPVDVASAKAEYAARTIRPKIKRLLPAFLKPLKTVRLQRPSLELPLRGMAMNEIDALLQSLPMQTDVPPAGRFYRGGAGEAMARLRRFIEQTLPRYAASHNQPQTDDVSHMSPYLHFGQISPLRIALEISQTQSTPELQASVDAYLEQLLIRRELAINFVHHTPDYDSYSCIPDWARQTLDAHRTDRREHLYGRDALESAGTHDAYWNAAMMEMRITGFMHTYMRMYWGKKILEWSPSPEQAFETLLALNNRYFIDGRDPNSYAGAAWIFGTHDRPWKERPIFGKVRYMAASGLERKCDIAAYVNLRAIPQ